MRRFLGPILILLCTLIWGTAFLAQKTGTASFGPFALTSFRNVLAGFFLLVCIKVRDRFQSSASSLRPSSSSYLLGGSLSGVALFGAMVFQQLGIETTTPGVSAFLTANYILIVPILSWAIGKGRPGWSVVLGVPLALVGSFLICRATANELSSIGKGELWTLLCAFIFAVQIMIVDRFASTCDVLKFSMVQMFVAAFCAAPFILLPSELARLSFASFRTGWFSLFYLGVMSSGIAYTLQNLGQARTPPALAAIVMSFESVVGAVSGYLVFGDVLTRSQLLGCAFVFLAVVLSQAIASFCRK